MILLATPDIHQLVNEKENQHPQHVERSPDPTRDALLQAGFGPMQMHF